MPIKAKVRHVYKLVALHGDQLLSFNTAIEDTPDAAMHPDVLLYKKGKWTEPVVEGTPLFAFETAKDAIHFLGGFIGNVKLWRAEAEDAQPFRPCPTLWDRGYCSSGILHTQVGIYNKPELMRKMWDGWQQFNNNKLPVREGQLVCTRIKLTRQLKLSK
jgi:hypothetical protein